MTLCNTNASPFRPDRDCQADGGELFRDKIIVNSRQFSAGDDLKLLLLDDVIESTRNALSFRDSYSSSVNC